LRNSRCRETLDADVKSFLWKKELESSSKAWDPGGQKTPKLVVTTSSEQTLPHKRKAKISFIRIEKSPFS